MISRFVDDAFGFALTWNYWFNDAVSTASDLVALQLVLQYWTDHFPGWALSLIFWFILMAVNIATVRAYGEVSKRTKQHLSKMRIMDLTNIKIARILAELA